MKPADAPEAVSGRIARSFAATRARKHSAFIPYIVAGDPDLEHTQRLVLELEARGADLIELGVPFSDPMADGPANQRASARGLAAGATLPAIFALVAELRNGIHELLGRKAPLFGGLDYHHESHRHNSLAFGLRAGFRTATTG